MSADSSRILLIGGGHSHVQFLKHWARQPLPGVEVVLVSDVVETPYSGMLPGRLAGWYSDRDMHFNLPNLCSEAGAVFIHDSAVGLNAVSRVATLATYPPLEFDWCSINVGLGPTLPLGAAGNPRVIPVKPISQLIDQWNETLSEADDSDQPWLIVGGGAAGFEIAIALAMAACKCNRRCKIQLLEAGEQILPGHSARVRKRAMEILKKWCIEVRVRCAVKKVHVQIAHLSTGEDITFERMLVTTAGAAPGWFKNSDLKLSEKGFLEVDDELRCSPRIFAAGDCAHFSSHPLSKAGVYAVRQGPVLIENLRALASGRAELEAYKPQRRALALLISGENRALLSYGPFVAEGEWLWRWKDRIDRGFMSMFSAKPLAMPDMTFNTCGGCGGKAPAQIVKEVVQSLGGDSKFKDVGYVENMALTVDGFRSFTDDLNFFGRVAVLHAFNDCFAAGVKPIGATVMATIPPAKGRIRSNRLLHLMSGVMNTLNDHGAKLINAHTAEGMEAGLSITAIGHAGRKWSKQNLATGQILILTKPLGCGALLQAWKQARLDEGQFEVLEKSLLSSHGPWMESTQVPIAAATDVSGFGLIGHLSEMMEGLRVSIELTRAIPALPGYFDLEMNGVSAFLTGQNRAAYSPLVVSTEPHSSIYYDPQTNGPLLLAVDEAHVDALLKELKGAGFSKAKKIGRVLNPSHHSIFFGN